MDWYHYVKKYVWDERKTPYLVAVAKLDRGQANSEIFLYAMFLGVPGALVATAATASVLESGSTLSAAVGAYALTICIAAGTLHARKLVHAAYYSITLPLALLVYLYYQKFGPEISLLDKTVLVIVLLLWLRYTIRVAAICKAYPGLPEQRVEDDAETDSDTETEE